MRIFYKSGIYTYQADPNLLYEQGLVVTFCGNREVKPCDSLSLPIGLVCMGYDPSLLPMDISISVGVAIGQGEYNVTYYEKGNYKINDILYCNDEGKLTNRKIKEQQPIIGVVNCVEENSIGLVTAFSNLEYARY